MLSHVAVVVVIMSLSPTARQLQWGPRPQLHIYCRVCERNRKSGLVDLDTEAGAGWGVIGVGEAVYSFLWVLGTGYLSLLTVNTHV